MAWYTARWGSLFVVTYLIAQGSQSPFLVQSAGALLFVPLLAGGFLGGMLIQRCDVWLLLRTTLGVLCLAAAVMTALALAGAVRLWTLFPFILLAGIGQLVNMTVHRAALFSMVGTRHGPHTLVVDALQMSSSMALGNVVGGALIEVGGPEAAFAGLMALHAVALAGYWRIRPDAPVERPMPASLGEQWRLSTSLLRRSRSLRLALAVTVTMNSLVFGYLSLVPLLVREFDPSALLASLLAAGDGFGQVCAGLVFTALGLRRPGLVLALGAMTTCTGILVFSQASAPGVAFAALVLAGTGTSGYAASQTVVALKDAEQHERGAVLGLVSTAIGMTPVGMILIGVLAGTMPAAAALALTTGTALGLVACIGFAGRGTLRAR